MHTHSAPHHHHHHHEGHSHAPEQYGRAFVIGITLNCLFVAAEVVYGLLAHSLALLADAGHNAGDVLGMLLAWGALWLSKRQPNERYTYGLQSATILAALINAVLLLVASGGIGWEAIQRFGAQQTEPHSFTVMAVAAMGIVVNGITAWLFLKGGRTDANIRGAYLHMAADALVSLGVVVVGALMWLGGWYWLDPLASLLIAAFIVCTSWGLLKDAFDMTLQATPKHIDYGQVKQFLASQKGVVEVHDLHIWAMSTNETSLSAHIRMQTYPQGEFLHQLSEALENQFRIGHSTIQVEVGEGTADCHQHC